ncbi:MAG TPA: hypothetical protein VK186_23125, partial [Candidatus Deferrimicrobium sp.]|nr:hypothetical protein [Candidatus Deferrimicrobium sp.]
MEKIAVCIDSYNIDYSPSIINLLDCLSDRFEIDLYIRNVFFRKSHVLTKDTIRIYPVRDNFSCSFLWKTGKRILKKVLKTTGLKKNGGGSGGGESPGGIP